MIKDIKKVVVKYNKATVGYLAELEDEKIGFQYDDEWVKNGFSISPFSLPLSNKIYISKKNLFSGLYGVFWDSLPDGWGELLINRLLSKKGINPDNLSILTKLSLIGNNGLGGLSYEPQQPLEEKNDRVNLDELSDEVTKILNDASDVDLDKIYALGGSSGGARPKAHIKIDGEDWIVKFACKIDPPDVGEKEFSANEKAKQCGINVNEYRLFPSGVCSGYFGAKRFDRIGERRVHMISLAAVLETTHKLPNLDYMHLFQVISNISSNKSQDLYEAFRRMCFNVLYENKDDHSKNFSFLYDETKKGYVLSPAYDITKTLNKYEHEMTVNGSGNPTKKDLFEIQKAFGLSLKKCEELYNNIIERI